MISGDKNSKYFHNWASQRFRRNKISELRNADGVLVSGDEGVSTMVVEYYSKLYTSSDPVETEEVVQFIKPMVTEEMNRDLIGEFSRDEVEVAVKQMAPLKAPGPDSMPPSSSKNFGTLLGMM